MVKFINVFKNLFKKEVKTKNQRHFESYETQTKRQIALLHKIEELAVRELNKNCQRIYAKQSLTD